MATITPMDELEGAELVERQHAQLKEAAAELRAANPDFPARFRLHLDDHGGWLGYLDTDGTEFILYSTAVGSKAIIYCGSTDHKFPVAK